MRNSLLNLLDAHGAAYFLVGSGLDFILVANFELALLADGGLDLLFIVVSLLDILDAHSGEYFLVDSGHDFLLVVIVELNILDAT
jgi:hypothetical protein